MAPTLRFFGGKGSDCKNFLICLSTISRRVWPISSTGGDCGSPILHLNIFSEHPFLQVTHTSEDGSPSSGEVANLASTIG